MLPLRRECERTLRTRAHGNALPRREPDVFSPILSAHDIASQYPVFLSGTKTAKSKQGIFTWRA
jgi:hypothetical protein